MKHLFIILSIIILSSCGINEPREVERTNIPNYVSKEAEVKFKKGEIDSTITVRGESTEYVYKVKDKELELEAKYDINDYDLPLLFFALMSIAFIFIGIAAIFS